jgi:hypothetical protein
MTIARITTKDFVFWFQPRGRAIEPAVMYSKTATHSQCGAVWLDLESVGNIPVEITKTPRWNIVGAVTLANDALRCITEAGKGQRQVAELCVIDPEFYLSHIDDRRAKLATAGRDILSLILFPVWERKKLSWAERAAELEKYGLSFNEDGDKNWRRLHERMKNLRGLYAKKGKPTQ